MENDDIFRKKQEIFLKILETEKRAVETLVKILTAGTFEKIIKLLKEDAEKLKEILPEKKYERFFQNIYKLKENDLETKKEIQKLLEYSIKREEELLEKELKEFSTKNKNKTK